MSDALPSRRTPSRDPSALLRQLASEARFEAKRLEDEAENPTAQSVLSLLAEIGRRRAATERIVSRVAASVGLPTGARDRIRAFLISRVGTVVDKDQISGVAGIHEWARRIRELRMEEGWVINSSQTRDDLKPGQYVLESGSPDVRISERWRSAHTIRRSGGSPSARLLRYLQANAGQRVAKDEVVYVSRAQDYLGLIAELSEQGLQIELGPSSDGLQPGEIRLVAKLPH